jgi:hypothetical protein
VGWKDPGVEGKSGEPVSPSTWTLPCLSKNEMKPTSNPSAPPRKVENSSLEPLALSLVTNASVGPPAKVGWKASGVVGNPVEPVSPVTTTLPWRSTSRPMATSKASPPR